MSELIIRSEAVYVSDGIATDITQLKRSIAPVEERHKNGILLMVSRGHHKPYRPYNKYRTKLNDTL